GLDEPNTAPPCVHRLLATEDAARGAGQDREQLELLGGELDGTALHPNLEAIPVDLEVTDLDVRLLLDVARSAPAGDGADARNELAWRERLGHVIVGAHLEAEDLVALHDEHATLLLARSGGLHLRMSIRAARYRTITTP